MVKYKDSVDKGGDLGTLTIKDIVDENIIPHRTPMLLLDRIMEVDEESAAGIVLEVEKKFQIFGADLNRSLMRLLSLEASAQVGAAMLSIGKGAGKIPLLLSLENWAFFSDAPNGRLVIEVGRKGLESKSTLATANIFSKDRWIATGEIGCLPVSPGVLRRIQKNSAVCDGKKSYYSEGYEHGFFLGVREPGKEGQYIIPTGSPFVQGHFPDNPIIPGVILVYLALENARRYNRGAELKEIRQVSFKKMASPGVALSISQEFDEKNLNIVKFQITDAHDVIAEGELILEV